METTPVKCLPKCKGSTKHSRKMVTSPTLIVATCILLWKQAPIQTSVPLWIKSSTAFNWVVAIIATSCATSSSLQPAQSITTWSKKSHGQSWPLGCKDHGPYYQAREVGERRVKPYAHATNGGGTGSGNTLGERKLLPLEELRKKFDGTTKVVENHHKGKDYNCLYITSHCKKHHKAWSKDKKDCTGKYYPSKNAAGKGNPTEPAKTAPQSSLGLNDCLQQVLMNNVMLSKGDVEKIFKAAQGN